MTVADPPSPSDEMAATRPSFRSAVLFTVAAVAATALTVMAIVRFADVLLLGFAGVLNAVLLSAITGAVQRVTRLPRALALALVCIVLLASWVGIVVLVAPEVARQVDALAAALPHAWGAVLSRLGHYDWGKRIIASLHGLGEPLLSRAAGFFSSTIGIVWSVIVVGVVGLFLAAEPETYLKGVTSLLAPRHRAPARSVLDELGNILRRWLRAVGIEMLVLGTLVWIGLTLLHIPLALTLALITAIACAIPNFGPIISIVPAVLVAFLTSSTVALYVLAFMVGMQMFQSYLLAPYIERRTVSLPPALTLLVQLVLGASVGAVGVLVATPFTAVMLVLVRRLYLDRLPETDARPATA